MGTQAAHTGRLIFAALLLLTACRQQPEAQAPALGNIDRGRELYLRNCVLCHGQRGDGEGLRKMGLSSKPRNFGDPLWRAQTSPQKAFEAIQNGVEGTSMPAFNSLDDAQTQDLVAYVLNVGSQKQQSAVSSQ